MKNKALVRIAIVVVGGALAPSLAAAPQEPARDVPGDGAAPPPPTAAAPPASIKNVNIDAMVKIHVLPALAGLRAAQLSSAALRELASSQPFHRADARRTAELAEQSLKLAHESVEGLRSMKELSGNDRTQVDALTRAVRSARGNVEAMQRQVGALEAPFRRNEIERIQAELPKLDASLEVALASVRQLAGGHAISTALLPSADAPAMGK